MSCFWQGIISSFNKTERKFFKIETNSVKDKNIINFIKQLKLLNKKTNNVFWNNQKLSEKELEENYLHIVNYDIETFNNGYYCSCADPFLFLIAHLLNVNIKYDYNDNIIEYNIDNNLKTLYFSSDTSHFVKN